MIKQTQEGYRFYDDESGKQLGEIIQEKIRLPEYQASLIVYEKYKRKHNLSHEDLINLRIYISDFSKERKKIGKKVSNDYLIQIASDELKKYLKIK